MVTHTPSDRIASSDDFQNIRLPPLHLPTAYSVPTAEYMERKPSISLASSGSSSDRSIYTPSRSSSPTSVLYDRTTSCERSYSPTESMQNSRHHPYLVNPPKMNGHRCPRCLDRQVTSWTKPGKPCPLCDLVESGKSSSGKAPRKKNTDRHLYSRTARRSANDPTPPKKAKESGARFDITAGLAKLQNALLAGNPRLKEGWKPLRTNNTSEDVEAHTGVTPLEFKKLNILDSTLLSWDQLYEALTDAVRELEELLAHCSEDAQYGYSPDRVAALRHRIAQITSRMTYVRDNYGEPPEPPQEPSLIKREAARL
jgi:hypothetical protein